MRRADRLFAVCLRVMVAGFAVFVAAYVAGCDTWGEGLVTAAVYLPLAIMANVVAWERVR